eukprot:jgi/Tetstr1/463256/TSEL_000713.t1
MTTRNQVVLHSSAILNLISACSRSEQTCSNYAARIKLPWAWLPDHLEVARTAEPECPATPSRYVTQKNRKNTPERLEIKKYNKFLRRVTVHKEIK